MLSHWEAARERECWGKSQSSQCKVIKPSHREGASESCKRGKTKHRTIVSGITDNTCCLYAVSELFGTILQEQFCSADVPLCVNRIWIEIKKTQSLQESTDGLGESTKQNISEIIHYSCFHFCAQISDIFLINSEHEMILLQNIFSIQCFLVISKGASEQAVRSTFFNWKAEKDPWTAGKDSVQAQGSNVCCTVTVLKIHTHANTRWRHKQAPTHTR